LLPLGRFQGLNQLLQPLSNGLLVLLEPLHGSPGIGRVFLRLARRGEVGLQSLILQSEALKPSEQLFDLPLERVEDFRVVHHLSCLPSAGARKPLRTVRAGPPRGGPFRGSPLPGTESALWTGR